MNDKNNFPLAAKVSIKVRAIFFAEHLDLKNMETADRLASFPLMLRVKSEGCAALFRYGVLVFFNVDPMDEISFSEAIKHFASDGFAKPEIDEVMISVNPDSEEFVANDVINIKKVTVERLQVIAEVLSKNVVLAYYEAKVSSHFDSIEPLAYSLKNKGSAAQNTKALLAHIGDTLLSLHTMVGRVEVEEKPEVIWTHPGLERFYSRLEDEYELRERHTAIERKLKLISDTSETVLDLIRTHQNHRLEWYIIALIIIEIIITLYELFIHPFVFHH